MAKRKPSDIMRDIDKALDRGMAKLVINTQSKLSASSPIDSGRLASSWFVGQGTPNRKERPEDWAEPGARRVEVERPSYEITMDSDHYISNNLPYAERAALDPGYVGNRGGGQGAWFTAVIDKLEKDANRIFTKELGKVK